MQMQGLTGNSGMQLCYTCRGAEDIAPASSNFGCSAAPETTYIAHPHNILQESISMCTGMPLAKVYSLVEPC